MRRQIINYTLTYHNLDTKLYLKRKIIYNDTAKYDCQLPVAYVSFAWADLVEGQGWVNSDTPSPGKFKLV